MATAQLLVPSLTATPAPSAASGLIALLEEDDVVLKVHALERLFEVVDASWSEVAGSVPLIEELSEDPAFQARELAASVASKCFFHLEEYEDALRLALGAGPHFDINQKTEYVDTLISKCIDQYTTLRVAADKDPEGADPIDPRMEDIVERMFQRCYNDAAYSQAMGIALETLRLDKVEEIIGQADDKAGLCTYTFQVCQELVTSKRARLSVLDIIVKTQRSLPEPDYVSICQCLQFLNRASEVADTLKMLIKGTEEQALLAYQVSLDLVESENQKFLLEVVQAFPELQPAKPAEAEPAAEGEEGENKQEEKKEEAAAMTDAPEANEEVETRMCHLRRVLSENFSTDLALNFLYGQNNTDLLVLKKIKTAVEGRNSVLHNATVVAHSIMQAGTTVDTFLRENLEWMGRATNWAKFTATASIGVVHRGHLKESMNLLQPYLPQGGAVTGTGYSEGGALYALGLIHANKALDWGNETIQYLRDALRNAGTTEAILHGACLGLGLAAMGSADLSIYEQLKDVLFQDNAVAGEAAALAIGLVLLGSGNASGDILGELLSYAHDTQHEKIIRALALAHGLIYYGTEEEADGLIEQLARDRDPLLRYGAMFTVGLAYVGTSNNSAIRRLLHVAVSDVSDDVRRAAVMCLGFVMYKNSDQVPRLVSLLSESFNPHVRYGACMAIGLACAGTANLEALGVLEPMMEDSVDFVRQGGMLAFAMVLMQQAEARVPAIKNFRDKLTSITTDKHQSTMTKMGAVMSAGILDAGGRNVTISMQSRAGFTKPSAVVGLAIWVQHWFWYPLMHFLPMAFSPTSMIGLNKDFKMPKNFQVKCNAKASHFAYPKKLEEKKEEKKEKIATVQLSTTAKAKAREARKKAEEEGKSVGAAGTMDVDKPAEKEDSKMEDAKGAEETKGEEKANEEKAEKPKKKEPEPSTFMVTNSSRVTPVQESLMEFDLEQRYVPVRQGGKAVGIIVLRDQQPGEPEDVEAVEAPALQPDEDEAEPPEPFEWTPGPDDM